MRTQYEDVPMLPETRHDIDAIATELLTKEPNRQGAAAIITNHGYAAHVGGHHVAIHRKNTCGECVGPRLALVTNNEGDWL